MRIFASFTSALIIFGASTSAFAQVIVRPFEAAAQEYYQILLKGKYDDLERFAAESRRKNLSISDGQPRLAAIYGGLAGCLTSGCRNRLSESEWQERLQLLSAWRKIRPESVTAEMAQAKFYVEHAYAIRGQGYANTVQPDAWPLFYKSMETAHALLDKASSGVKQDPEWYATMLDIGVAEAWSPDKFSNLYSQARSNAPLYIPIYFNASAYFSPRWHGSAPDLRKFIEDAVDNTRQKLGETLYARLNWNLTSNTMFTDGQADWQRMKTGFERIVADFPDPWNINNFAKFACLANDGITVLKIAEQIRDEPIEAAWWGSADNYRKCVANARLTTQK